MYCGWNGKLMMQKKTFSFAVRDSLVNIGPLRDLAYGLRSNADAAASGLSKQSNYELVGGPHTPPSSS
jgi:cleavage and polyadenylation specificity factor subunit 1